MRTRCRNQRSAALTVWEVLIVVALLALAAVLALFAQHIRGAARARRISCVSNLKVIGGAYRGFEMDLGGLPMYVPRTNGGSLGAIFAFQHFQVLSNELMNPQLLVCPADRRRVPAKDFAAGLSDKNVSYFVGLEASTNTPNAFLAGDRNLIINGIEAKTGLASLTALNVLSWTSGTHVNVGDVALADGSVQTLSSARLGAAIQNSGLATNRLLFP